MDKNATTPETKTDMDEEGKQSVLISLPSPPSQTCGTEAEKTTRHLLWWLERRGLLTCLCVASLPISPSLFQLSDSSYTHIYCNPHPCLTWRLTTLTVYHHVLAGLSDFLKPSRGPEGYVLWLTCVVLMKAEQLDTILLCVSIAPLGFPESAYIQKLEALR